MYIIRIAAVRELECICQQGLQSEQSGPGSGKYLDEVSSEFTPCLSMRPFMWTALDIAEAM